MKELYDEIKHPFKDRLVLITKDIFEKICNVSEINEVYYVDVMIDLNKFLDKTYIPLIRNHDFILILNILRLIKIIDFQEYPIRHIIVNNTVNIKISYKELNYLIYNNIDIIQFNRINKIKKLRNELY